MRVLWVCNRCLPVVAAHLNMDAGNKEGWLAGLSERILAENNDKLTLGVCFPAGKDLAGWKGDYEVTAYGFYEDTAHPERYDEKLEERMQEIVNDFKPDMVHIFGTEFPHTLAMVRAFNNPSKTLIGIQGLCFVYADAYLEGLPEEVVKRSTLRDVLKKDSILDQQKKFYRRGAYEQKALALTGNVTGRTDWDRHYTKECNANVTYYFMNETLRSNFYEGIWDYKTCEKHSIFVSQGDYPIKGLHFLLRAMKDVLEEYSDAKVYVAGNCITGDDGLKKKIKMASYGKYLKELIEQYKLEEHIVFLGNLNAGEMKQRYLTSNVFVSPSTMENSPNSVGEAMILGVPVISTRVGGVHNLLEDQKEGILYEPTNVQALSNAIIKVFDAYEYEDASRMRPIRVKEEEIEEIRAYPVNAREHALRTHNPDINYHRLLEIYEDICKCE